MSRSVGDAAAAGAVAAVLSGAPSTAIAVVRGDDVLESVRAAGTMLLGEDGGPWALVVAGGVAHVAISAFWALVLTCLLPRRRTVLWGAGAGLAIAALDLGIIGRRFPRIAALPAAPQVADHLAFGAIVGAVLARR